MLKMSVLGSGGFGCAIASIYEKVGYDITLWSYSAEEAQKIKNSHENVHYLPGVFIPETIHITSNIQDIFDSDIICIVVPSFAVKATMNLIQNKISKSSILICLSKGLDETSMKTFSQIMYEMFPDNQQAILSGPSHAEEIANNITTALVVSSNDIKVAKYIQNTLSTQNVRIYINEDIIGVQIGAALKNIIALGIGICDGMKLGDNTKSALMTRGLNEIAKIGVALGAKKETFYGLSGVGDLIVTCTSLHSRNHRAGILIGQGMNVKDAIEKVAMTVEGYTCAKIAHRLCLTHNLELPIIEQMYQILYNNKNPYQALKELLSRPYKFEE